MENLYTEIIVYGILILIVIWAIYYRDDNDNDPNYYL